MDFIYEIEQKNFAVALSRAGKGVKGRVMGVI
jgi:hypothetical protein